MNSCNRDAVVASYLWQYSAVYLPPESRILSKRCSALTSSRKQIRLPRFSRLFESNSTFIRPLLRTFNGRLKRFKRVGARAKGGKIEDDHEFWMNMWRQSVLRLSGVHGISDIDLAIILQSLKLPCVLC